MLKYEVRQLYLADKERYYLPIPKLNLDQFRSMADDLRSRGFSVAPGDKLTARLDDSRVVISRTGLAWSSSELLDAVVPSVARLLDTPKAAPESGAYFAAKKTTDGFEIQLFLRLEGLGLWSSLRRQDGCGLTPDEALVIETLVGDSNEHVDCVTDYPTDGCSAMQVGRHQYYRSSIPAKEFATRLRTISRKSSRNVYLPRTSIIRILTSSITVGASLSDELGEWCYNKIPPQNL